ncbi:unnamed protein product, partial [Mesorhabditis spiculigera]
MIINMSFNPYLTKPKSILNSEGRHRDPPLWPMDDPRRISLNWGNEPSTLIVVIKYLALAMIVSFVIWFLWPIKRAPVEFEEDEDEESESEFGEDTEAEYDIVKKDS